MIGFAAYLRVYEPVGALPEPEQRLWSAMTEAGAGRTRLLEREHQLALAAAARAVPRVRFDDGVDAAYVRLVDGVRYVCPWRWQLRVWDALEEFRAGLADQIADAFLPAAVVDAATAEAERWRARHPQLRAPIRCAAWHVSVTWFTLFDPDERRLILGDRRVPAPGRRRPERSLIYLTAMSRARRRLARALHVVQRTLEGAAVDVLEDLGRWLEEFHPHALVELDYGGLVYLLDDEALTGDESVADVAAALQALADGDPRLATACYNRVGARWRAVAERERAN